MQQYIGTKIIQAEPGPAPKDMGEHQAGTEGYLVTYPDGYISWSPKDVFEEAYKPTDCMNFGLAVEAMKIGKKVARQGWNGKNMFLFLVPGSTFKVSRAPLLGIYPEGHEINYNPHVDMRTADGSIVPWLASQTDVLGNDWVIVDSVRL